MSIKVLKVLAKEAHPYADSLTLYQMGGIDGVGAIPVIANQENTYEVGDLVSVALPDTILQDGTQVLRTKIRGVLSAGMALGATSLYGLGEDVTAFHGATSFDRGSLPPMIPWPSVGGLHDVKKFLHGYTRSGENPMPTLAYKAKVKLDGTNAGVQITPDGHVYAQSRGRVITAKDDNMGFAAWVEKNRARFTHIRPGGHTTVFGEWCGLGIQKGVAISQIGKRIFAVFAILVGDPDQQEPRMIDDPDMIRDLVKPMSFPDRDCFVLPWYTGAEPTIAYGDRNSLLDAVELINNNVTDVERCDPWVADNFGVRGIGEGLVFYPQGVAFNSFENFAFKAKGVAHRVVKTELPARVDPEVVRSIEEFVTMFVTETRLQQGVTEGCGGDLDMKQMGKFLGWFAKDVQKESLAELEANGLTWKDVQKAVTDSARAWYKATVVEATF